MVVIRNENLNAKKVNVNRDECSLVFSPSYFYLVEDFKLSCVSL